MFSRVALAARRTATRVAPRVTAVAGLRAQSLTLLPSTTVPARHMSNAKLEKAITSAIASMETESRNFQENPEDIDTYLQDTKGKVDYNKVTGDVTVTFEREKCNITLTFNQEFEYPDERDEQNDEYSDQRDYEGARGEDDAEEEDLTAFHRVEVTVRLKDGSAAFRATGTVNLRAEFLIDGIVPLEGETELRTIASADLSEQALEDFEIAMEELILDSATCDFIVKFSRKSRVEAHVEALSAIAKVFKAIA